MDINSLDRFLKAQEHTFHIAMEELMNGQKQSHWMWFMFPQPRGLGMSPTAHIYGISGLEEAIAYLNHYVKLKNQLEKEYSYKYEPLSVRLSGESDDNKWLWALAPMPWEGGCR